MLPINECFREQTYKVSHKYSREEKLIVKGIVCQKEYIFGTIYRKNVLVPQFMKH